MHFTFSWGVTKEGKSIDLIDREGIATLSLSLTQVLQCYSMQNDKILMYLVNLFV